MIFYDKNVKTRAKELANECLPSDYKLGEVVNLGSVCKKLGIDAKYEDNATKAIYSSEDNVIVLPRGQITPYRYLEIAMAIGEKVMDSKDDNVKYAFAIELLLPYEYMKRVQFFNGFAFEEIAQKYHVPYSAVQTREATLYLHGSFRGFKDVKSAIDDFKKDNPSLTEDNGNFIDTVKALKNKYGITCYEGGFEDKKTEAFFNAEDKSLTLSRDLTDEKSRIFRAICLAKHIMSDAKGEKVPSFWHNAGDPFYKDVDEKKLFDAATEILIANNNFKDVALKHHLDDNYIAKLFNTSRGVVLTKLDNADLLR